MSYEFVIQESYEAEGRRITRFWDYGHSPSSDNGALQPVIQGVGHEGSSFTRSNDAATFASLKEPAAELPSEEYPCTLDLRYDERI